MRPRADLSASNRRAFLEAFARAAGSRKWCAAAVSFTSLCLHALSGPCMASSDSQQHYKKYGVAGHLKAEVTDLLQRDREDTGHCSDSDPVVRRSDGYQAESTTYCPREGEDHKNRWDAHE